MTSVLDSCMKFIFLSDDNLSTTDSDGTLSDSDVAESLPRKVPPSAASSVNSALTHVSDLSTPLQTPLSGAGLINPGFVFEFPNAAYLKSEVSDELVRDLYLTALPKTCVTIIYMYVVSSGEQFIPVIAVCK